MNSTKDNFSSKQPRLRLIKSPEGQSAADSLTPTEVKPIRREPQLAIKSKPQDSEVRQSEVATDTPPSRLRVKALPPKSDIFAPTPDPGKTTIKHKLLPKPHVVVNPDFLEIVRSLRADTSWREYQIVKPLGMGITGATFQAIHKPTSKLVAIKMLDIPYDEDCRTRFHDICSRLRNITHLSLCKLTDHIWQPPHLAIVTELLTTPQGLAPNLTGYCKKFRGNDGFAPQRNVLKVGYQLAAALAELHRLGIVHGNLKPANLLFKYVRADDGGWRLRLRVTDIGVAQIMGKDVFQEKLKPVIDHDDMADQAAVETGAFMAPEQWQGEDCSEKTDIFSCGALIHYFLLRRFLPDRPKPSSIRPDIHHGWDPILGKAMRPNPDRRFQSAVEMAECLDLIDVPKDA